MSGGERASRDRRLREELAQAREEIERLRRLLEEALRATKRQAAPHSRGKPKAKPKWPGRKSRENYGQHRLAVWSNSTSPWQCGHRGGNSTPIRSSTRSGVDRRTQQTSDARGAAQVQVGPEALARLADKAAPTYEGLIQTARQSLVNGVDETGWRVGGRLQWMWTAVSEQVTLYMILPGRGFPEAALLLGAEYGGWIGCWPGPTARRATDGWPNICAMNNPLCSPFCGVPAWTPPTTPPSGRCGAS